MKHSEVMQVLPTFSERELREVKAACEHLLSRNADAGPVYGALMAVLGINVSYAKFQRLPVYKTYKTGEAEMMRFVEATWGEHKKIPLHGLLKYLLQLVVDDLQSQGLRPYPLNVAAGMNIISTIFEHQFPGYKEAGLCGSILTAMSLAR